MEKGGLSRDAAVLLQVYVGLGWALGCALIGLLIVKQPAECRIGRQYLCQVRALCRPPIESSLSRPRCSISLFFNFGFLGPFLLRPTGGSQSLVGRYPQKNRINRQSSRSLLSVVRDVPFRLDFWIARTNRCSSASSISIDLDRFRVRSRTRSTEREKKRPHTAMAYVTE